jgi:hypothetical protein
MSNTESRRKNRRLFRGLRLGEETGKPPRFARHRRFALLNDAVLTQGFPDRFRAHSSVGRADDS